MVQQSSRHFNEVFILQLWQEKDPDSSEKDPLRIILENPKTGEHFSFQTLDELFIFLADCLPSQMEESWNIIEQI